MISAVRSALLEGFAPRKGMSLLFQADPCLSDEKGGQIFFLILHGLKSVQSGVNWYSFLISHGPEQPSGTSVSSFKSHSAHFFTYSFLTPCAICSAEIGHTWLCSLTLWFNTPSYLVQGVLQHIMLWHGTNKWSRSDGCSSSHCEGSA